MKLIQGDCIQILRSLADDSLDAIVIDPPYGESMGYDGDGCISEADALLTGFLRAASSKLKKNRHIAVFWTMRNLDVCIDAIRSCGFTYRRTLSMYIPKGGARPYLGWLPRTQAIVIAQKYLASQPSEFHFQMAAYLAAAVERVGISKGDIAKQLNCNSRLVMKWTRQGDPAWCLPTPRFYGPLKKMLNLDSQFDVLLDREPAYAHSLRDFDYKHDTYVVDVSKEGKMIHPSQKPLSVVKHIVSCLTQEGEVVFDGFMGSGTTGVACLESKRDFVGVDISPDFYNISKNRIEGVRTL
jgi:DNA modification methylase